MSGRDFISTTRPELKALYARIGGEEKLLAILTDFYRRMAKDLMIGFFFTGKDPDQVAARQKDFLMAAFGATTTPYAGKPPAQAHEKLAPIRTGHFDRRLTILEETLRDHGVGAEDIRTWVSFENAFRDVVVG